MVLSWKQRTCINDKRVADHVNASAVKKGEDWELDIGFSKTAVSGDSACQSFEEEVWITAWLGGFRREWNREMGIRNLSRNFTAKRRREKEGWLEREVRSRRGF